jgi:phosphatidate cytidylyltransferase
MLLQRVITALLMVAVLLPALFHPDTFYLVLVSLVLIALAGWEWGRLIGCQSPGAVVLGLLCLLLCGVSAWLDWQRTELSWLWAGMALLWVLGSVWMLQSGLSQWGHLSRLMRAGLGLLVLWSTWMALNAAKAKGTNFTLSILVLVWAADIAAYFTGRALGRHKLAPSISPGKSWEGVGGALAGVATLSLVWLAIDDHQPEWSSSIYTLLARQGGLILALGVLFLTAMSVVGDLAESLVKRSAGVKDSSQLLPGHGGVLDRVDALLPTLPIAMWLASRVAP